ncbi:hypothetical protein [Microbulbifer taiwanensis]|uniref:DUF1640 domain-containing protein n=1 Tax=Microbulbifer taiwanensis TaxID=986746 RepID=A0ABW1YPM2_9GAMM|nr:hypothetical protein [Microbulbifer taiwanensis]
MANLTEQQAEELARRAAREAMEDLMEKLGVDTSDFLEVQKDFAHLRQQRKASDQIGVWTRRILLGIFITTVCGILFAGIKSGLKGLL